ncbi:hypothetical protein OPV22_014749 [Ensete ventricosum]|uniref:Uncharacterized protein n=1 Tax=Ensete ventricosum TaxID=4639 RepID=A0AAV8PKV5_ENSVE|nr:hypothetical protein OPV22_014749 [Ensete ventricosum]
MVMRAPVGKRFLVSAAAPLVRRGTADAVVVGIAFGGAGAAITHRWTASPPSTCCYSTRISATLIAREQLQEEEKKVEYSLAVESSPPLSTPATSDSPPTTNYCAEAVELSTETGKEVRSAGRLDKLVSSSIIDLKQTSYGAGSSIRVPITGFCHLFDLNKVRGQLA